MILLLFIREVSTENDGMSNSLPYQNVRYICANSITQNGVGHSIQQSPVWEGTGCKVIMVSALVAAF